MYCVGDFEFEIYNVIRRSMRTMQQTYSGLSYKVHINNKH